MPVIYFSKRERIKKNEQNKAVDEMEREKPVELENTISMPSNTLYGDNEANHLAKKN